LHHQRQHKLLKRLNRVDAGDPDLLDQRATAKMKGKFLQTIKERW
jgi:hypothetical protein